MYEVVLRWTEGEGIVCAIVPELCELMLLCISSRNEHIQFTFIENRPWEWIISSL